jgi:hypothetical protein
MAGMWLILVTHEFHADAGRDRAEDYAGSADAGDHYSTDKLRAGSGYDPDTLEPWRDAHWGWAELRDAVRARAGLGGVDRAALDSPMPLVGLICPRPVAGNAAATPVSRAAYDAVVAGARRGSGRSAALRHVLREVPQADLGAALAGAAAGLGEAGYGIVSARVSESRRRWRDLWLTSSTAAAAALVLRACRISDTDAARLRVSDVAVDGSSVATRRRSVPVPAGAMPFLRAQRLVAGPDARQFLLNVGQPVGSTGVDRLVREGLAALGLEAPSGPRAPDPAPSAAWLLDRGIALRGDGLRPPPSDRETVSPRRCRHSLPDWIEVGGVHVSHSQRLCRTFDIDELAPAGSEYAVIERRVENGVAVYIVDSSWGRATYWQVPTPLGPAWLQSRAACVPVAAAVADGVAFAQRCDTLRVNRVLDPSTQLQTTRNPHRRQA